MQNYANGSSKASAPKSTFTARRKTPSGSTAPKSRWPANYLAIGGQGYAEEGVLNFICDAYYVKLNGFDLGPEGGGCPDRSLAEKIAAAIGGRNTLPEILAAFPAAGKIAHSERFILSNFLGHDFLRSAFAADYDRTGRTSSCSSSTPAAKRRPAPCSKNTPPWTRQGLGRSSGLER